jgi:hypothetical protein
VAAPDADLFNAAAAFVKTHAHLVNAPPSTTTPSGVADQSRRTDAAGASGPPSALATKSLVPGKKVADGGGVPRSLSFHRLLTFGDENTKCAEFLRMLWRFQRNLVTRARYADGRRLPSFSRRAMRETAVESVAAARH